MIILYITTSIVYILLLSLTILNGRYFKAGIGEKPLMYSSVIIQFIFNISFIGWIILSIVLVILNWKLLLGLLIGGFVLGSFLFVPVIEYLLAYFANWLIEYAKKKQENIDSTGGNSGGHYPE